MTASIAVPEASLSPLTTGVAPFLTSGPGLCSSQSFSCTVQAMLTFLVHLCQPLQNEELGPSSGSSFMT